MTMKTSTNQPEMKQYRQSRPTNKKSSSPGRVHKSSAEKAERQKTLDKLRQMVGGQEGCSQLEIMQHVIDYIQHLCCIVQSQANDQNCAGTPHSSNEKENREGPMQILKHLNNHMVTIFKS